VVVFALVPYLTLSAAQQPLTPIIAEQLHMSLQALSLAEGMANAGYAIGTVLAVQFALRLPQRRMLLLYGVLFADGFRARGLGRQPSGVHRRPCAPGPVHEPRADRGRPAAGRRPSGPQSCVGRL
jgi:pimeloyl-ACP methyl ester carboxylesterase